MKCPKCGGEVGEKDRFCEKCGRALRQGVEGKWRVIVVVLVLGIVVVGYLITVNQTPTPGINKTVPQTPISAPAIVNSIGMEFILIPAGEFDMGSPTSDTDSSDNERPVHHVRISSAFYMGKYEVTQKQWLEVNGTNPSYFKGDNLPVETVSWNDVQDFIRKLNEKEAPEKYRLPSESEWEFAARAGTTTRYSFGDDESKLGDYAWYIANSGDKTHNVGQKKPNPWGLYDVHGNVWEWVQDTWHSDYNGAPNNGSSWEGGSSRVIRGGGWYRYVGGCPSALRYSYDASFRLRGIGFRLVRDL